LACLIQILSKVPKVEHELPILQCDHNGTQKGSILKQRNDQAN
jgi:hypothetical protein